MTELKVFVPVHALEHRESWKDGMCEVFLSEEQAHEYYKKENLKKLIPGYTMLHTFPDMKEVLIKDI